MFVSKTGMLQNCQKNKEMEIIKLVSKKKNDNRQMNYNYNSKNYNIQSFLKMNNIQISQNIKNIVTNKEFYIDSKISDILFQYKSTKNLQKNDLILKIVPKNSLIFGILCFSKDFQSFLDIDNINLCYNINTENLFSIVLDIEEISDEDILYFHIKGKISGFFELLELSTPKLLDISSSYYFPMISDNSLKNLQLSIPDFKENICLNFMLDNNNVSAFEIYENEKKININNNDLSNLIILKKGNKYYFKYNPYNDGLIINFLDCSLNKIFNKTFYAFDSHSFFINYNILDKKK